VVVGAAERDPGVARGCRTKLVLVVALVERVAVETELDRDVREPPNRLDGDVRALVAE
jgi:hypothetical protein